MLTPRDRETVSGLLAELLLDNDAAPPSVDDPPPTIVFRHMRRALPTPEEWALICDRTAELLHALRLPHEQVRPHRLAPTADHDPRDRRVADHTITDLEVAGVWQLGLNAQDAHAFATSTLEGMSELSGLWTWKQIITYRAPINAQPRAEHELRMAIANTDINALLALVPPKEKDQIRKQVQDSYQR